MSEINVITATFGSQRKAMTMPIVYQYDVVQMLKIRGLDLPTYYEVEFCNDGDTTTVNITGSAAEGAVIPDSLIQTGRKIKAYIVLTYQDSVQTRYEITIPVYRREPRNDIDPTDDQQLQIDALVAALNDAINRAEAVEDLLMGGDEDQILRKNSDDDLDFSWTDEQDVPTKTSDLTNDSGFITASDVPVEVFLATYQSTEYAEVAEADTAGKIVLCLYNGRYYLLTKPAAPGDTNFYFTSPANVSDTGVSVYCVYVDYLNGWHATSATVKPTIITPKMDGSAAVGSTYEYARADHVHPSDTSKADVEDVPTKTSDLTNDSGFITAEDVPVEVFWAEYGTTTYDEIGAALTAGKLVMCENGGIYYTYAMRMGTVRYFASASLQGLFYWMRVTSSDEWDTGSVAIPSAATASPLMDGTAAVGSSSKYAKEDHVHPSDTSKITMPSGGSVGQVLKKTADGTEWANESGGGGGTSDYDDLTDKPQINSVTLSGNKSASDLGLGTYSKPSGGIPASDMASAVQTSLGKADSAYQKPSGGIPASDLASGVIPTVPSAATAAPADLGTAAVGSSSKYAKEDHVHKLPTLSELGAEPAWSAEANIQDGAVTKSLSERVSCIFTGALTSLTITLGGDATGHYHFDFSTGSTAPTLTLPSAVLTPDGFTVEANKAYEVDILNKHAAIQSWSLS